MAKYSMTRSMPYSARQLFDIAADVDSYRKFLPLVKESRAFDIRGGQGGKKTFKGELVVRYKRLGINERLVSNVTVDTAALTVTSRSNEGAVEHLDSNWRFVDKPGGCDVEFNVDYKMRRRAIQFLISGMFDMALRKIHSAFEARARELYGSPATEPRKPVASS